MKLSLATTLLAAASIVASSSSDCRWEPGSRSHIGPHWWLTTYPLENCGTKNGSEKFHGKSGGIGPFKSGCSPIRNSDVRSFVFTTSGTGHTVRFFANADCKGKDEGRFKGSVMKHTVESKRIKSFSVKWGILEWWP
ncbi:hypothetical protein BV22DRAFT_1045027 [Leucogyrophana mollusca]|uniref:Uncharacterized protein n=1 Tax=Leucogyrophana mollusca TaxID=85980 RepID=A0ACB8BQK3_9AGAM|nr:hypothetical protein BV22DRAFT_1045027 [Leucogyrophana mollusca]